MPNRNVNSRFAYNPDVKISRSVIPIPAKTLTSFNVGDVIPIYQEEVLPGDSFKVRSSKLVRLQTLLAPVMDDLYLDTYFFFVPYRLVWDHWQNFMGESANGWLPNVEYTVPQLTAPSGGWAANTIADYFAIPTGIDNLSVSALPFRAYAKIMNDWFRDENLQAEVYVPTGDSNAVGSNGNSQLTELYKGGETFKAAKYHDYFTSALPSPQRHADVLLPLGKNAPVYTTSETHDNAGYPLAPAHLVDWKGRTLYASPSINSGSAGSTVGDRLELGVNVDTGSLTGGMVAAPNNTNNRYPMLQYTEPTGTDTTGLGLVIDNQYADLSQATATTVNQIRLAFALQQMYEIDARGGSRYIELIKNHFGVDSPDSRLQRSEYLGGNRVPITISQVVSHETNASAPQGHTAAYSVTADTHNDFDRSFTEHGIIIGVCVARYKHTYQQGLHRMWSRQAREDFYWPALANLGEQAILNKEIFAQGSSADDQVFGYQENYAEYRYHPNVVTAQMRSNYATSLDHWHFADYYDSLPSLSGSWIHEDPSNVDRALAVTSAVSDQLFGDFYFDVKATRPMPVYSIPGFTGHH